MVTARAGTPGRGVFVLAVLAAVLAGCGQPADVAAHPATGPAAARATAPSAAGSDLDGATPVMRLRRSLLGPDDLGPGWFSGEPPLPDPSAPAPCGGPGTVARFPDALRVGSTVTGPAGLVVQEALSVYDTAATAQAAFRAAVAGLSCSAGTLHGAPATIDAAQDLRAEVGGEQASGWRVGSDDGEAQLVVVQARQAVFAFAYVTPPGAASGDRPDARALSRVAVARTLAA